MAHGAVSDTTGSGESAGLRRSLTLAALGVVYGDIGTSPLYAVKQSLVDFGDTKQARDSWRRVADLLGPGPGRYGQIRLRHHARRQPGRGRPAGADRAGAAHRRIATSRATSGSWRRGLVGAALFYGDGVITPAISVLSAVEGLEGRDPAFRALCHSDRAGAAGRRCLSCRAAAPRPSAGCSARSCWSGSRCWRCSGSGAFARSRDILLALNPIYGVGCPDRRRRGAAS